MIQSKPERSTAKFLVLEKSGIKVYEVNGPTPKMALLLDTQIQVGGSALFQLGDPDIDISCEGGVMNTIGVLSFFWCCRG